MKKISLIAAGLLLAMPFISSAQYAKGDQEFSLSYGRESGTDIIRGFQFNTTPRLDHSSYNSAISKTGNIFASYSYFLTSRLAVGLTLGTEFVSFNHYTNQDQPLVGPVSYPAGTYRANVTTLAFELKPIYYNGRLVQLYGLFGVGGRHYSEKMVSSDNLLISPSDNYTAPWFLNTQWTPIGVHVGKTLSGFLEFGIGYKGLINGGISYKLARKAKPAVAAKAE